MDNQVTPRAIAYAAIQVGSLSLQRALLLIPYQLILALSDAPNWKEGLEGYDLSALYNFIVDYFEAPDLGPKARERTKSLIAWWNR
jgi:hypothetical protein